MRWRRRAGLLPRTRSVNGVSQLLRQWVDRFSTTRTFNIACICPWLRLSDDFPSPFEASIDMAMDCALPKTSFMVSLSYDDGGDSKNTKDRNTRPVSRLSDLEV